MTSPKLAIVIPTHNRPETLPRALESALNQKCAGGSPAPVKIILADDGDPDPTNDILWSRFKAPFLAGKIVHLKTGASGAWENWRAGAEAADTPYISWLQDDDIISEYYAFRILAAFQLVEQAGGKPHVWFGRLDCAESSGRFGLMYCFNGPWVPMKTLYDQCEPIHFAQGQCVAASMYLTAWSLSPALAYRNGPEFKDALRRMPPNLDVFVERIIPAEMAQHGGFIADPAVVGYWVMHDDNLSRKQHADQPRQTRVFIHHMDDMLDRLPGWRDHFLAWCNVIPPGQIIGWFGNLDHAEKEGGRSRHGDAIRGLMIQSLKGRVKGLPGPWWQRAKAWARDVWRRAVQPPRSDDRKPPSSSCNSPAPASTGQ